MSIELNGLQATNYMIGSDIFTINDIKVLHKKLKDNWSQMKNIKYNWVL